MADLKKVYAAPPEETVLSELDSYDEKWSGKYHKISKSWRDNWSNPYTYFKYNNCVLIISGVSRRAGCLSALRPFQVLCKLKKLI